MLYLIIVLLALNITLFIAVMQIRHRLDIFDQWADQVDEFMDSEYIVLDMEDKE